MALLNPFNSLCAVGFFARFSYALARNPVLPRFALYLGAGPEAIGTGFPAQNDLFGAGRPHPATELLEALDVNDLTPRQALDKLYELKALLLE